MRRPLFPRKQTWIGPARAGKLGEFQRFSPGGLFGLSFNFLRMNQPHRSATIVLQRFDHPHHGLERTHSLMVWRFGSKSDLDARNAKMSALTNELTSSA